MFGDLIAGTSVSLLALAFAGTGVMRLVTWDVKRARWQCEFGGGWRELQRDRIARAVQPRRPAPLRPGELVAGGSRHGGASTPGAPRAIGA